MQMQATVGVAVSIALGIAGIVLLWIGMRGKRIGEHPICQRCGFDLFGLPPGVTHCSECGSDVTPRGAVQIGHRVRRKACLTGGLAILLPLALWIGVSAWVTTRNIDLNPYKPVWWLLNDTTDTKIRDLALAELANRLRNNQLTSTQIQQLIDRALQIQQDTTQPWTTRWGDLVELAHDLQKLPTGQWQRYLLQALQGLRLEARPQVRRGAPLPVRIIDGPKRLGTTAKLWAKYELGNDRWQLSNVPCPMGGKLSSNGLMSATEKSELGLFLPADHPQWAQLQPGPQTVQLLLTANVYDSSNPPNASPNSKPVLKTRLKLEANWELVNDPLVRVIQDESLRESVEKSLKAKLERVPGNGKSGHYLSVEIGSSSPPVALAYEVLLRQQEKQWKVGLVAFKARNGIWGSAFLHDAQMPDGNRVDVILRPSIEAAEQQVDMRELWDGQVILHDVEITNRP
ncbi:MAG TPA: hypothetical protein VHP11_14125 [Tepidisphaeraceae bacterium]|nr:hypothetical protein [Tepidisphaeraceae bacterium]